MNRIDPYGDLHAVAARGSFTGNRGCLVDEAGTIVRHHANRAWITCVLSFKARRHPLDAPRTWTPIFFLDEAVALAAGHRPCAECRRDAYNAYRDAIGLRAPEIDRRLAAERLPRGRGLQRAADRPLRQERIDRIPLGTVVATAPLGATSLVTADGIRPFTFAGWGPAQDPPSTVLVLTPPTSVEALANGYVPQMHQSAGG